MPTFNFSPPSVTINTFPFSPVPYPITETVSPTGGPFLNGTWTASLTISGVRFGPGGGILVAVSDPNNNTIFSGPYPTTQNITLSLSTAQINTINTTSNPQNWTVTLNYTTGGYPVALSDTQSIVLGSMALNLNVGTPSPPPPPSTVSTGQGQGGGGGPIQTTNNNPVVSYIVTTQSGSLTFFDLTPVVVTITLLDANGNPTNAPASGQKFILNDGQALGVFSPSNMVQLPGGYGIFQVIYTNYERGSFSVTVTPDVGPLLGQNPQTVLCNVNQAPTDPGVYIMLTRPRIRDMIRRVLGITPPVDRGGMPGEEPAGAARPDNASLNQSIASTLAEIARRAQWNTVGPITLNVPPMPTNTYGIQWVPITGLNTSPFQPNTATNTLDTIYRVVYQDRSSNVPSLTLSPMIQSEFDFRKTLLETTPPSFPCYYIYRYQNQLGLYPGSASGGTLQITASGMPLWFTSDTEVLSNLPLIFVDMLVQGAASYTCQKWIDDPAFAQKYQLSRSLFEQALTQFVFGATGQAAGEAASTAKLLTNRMFPFRHGFVVRRRR